ncbi:MAG: aminotransferase class V-fold PLP-dependent enzyme [Deltaproteobacteria bacterium]
MPSDKSRFRDLWALRPGVTYLNHGSFGPSPKVVTAARQRWIEELESEPMDFLVRQMEGHLERARLRLGEAVGTSGDNLIFVDNATFAMNIVAASFPLAPGDEVLATNHEYGAVLRIWRDRCRKTGAKLIVQKLPESFVEPGEVVEEFLRGVTGRTKLIVVSHITSPTALILPVGEICRRAKKQSIRVCIDGPHALAAVPVDIDRLDCDFYCASCHKWLSAPFGSGFLYAHPRWKQTVQPIVVSWGSSPAGRPPSWQDEFIWSGTRDPSPFLAVPAAIDFLANLSAHSAGRNGMAGANEAAIVRSSAGNASEAAWLLAGADAVEGVGLFREISGSLVEYARRKITAVTHLEPIGVSSRQWYGTMITLPLPVGVDETPVGHIHPLQAALWERFQIEAPVVNWSGRRHIRVSCHLYNDVQDLDRLAAALEALLVAREGGKD